jgi:hypothetical protein
VEIRRRILESYGRGPLIAGYVTEITTPPTVGITARANGAPDPLCASIYVRSEAGRNWLRAWNELLNGGVLPIPLKELVRVLI